MSADQASRDLADCQYQALLNAQSTSVTGATLGQTLILSELVESNQRSRQNQMIQACMTAKGYSPVSKEQMQASDQIQTLESLAESGHAPAQFRLGSCYANGDGVTQDWFEAANWFRKSAEQNYLKAQLAIGNCYWFGTGVRKDAKEASRWFSLAAAQGDEYAKSNLAIIRFYENPDEATKLDPSVNVLLLGHWVSQSIVGNELRGQMEIYFMPNNRYKMLVNRMDQSGQPLPESMETGRYFFTGNQLFTRGDNDKEQDEPMQFSVTSTELRLEEKQLVITLLRLA